MIGIDTNVLVRFLTQDDPVQSPQAARFMATLSADETGFVNVVTLAELAWVLERSFRLSHGEVADAILLLLESDTLTFESVTEVFAAFALLEEGKGSLGDALIGQLALSAGCSHVATFDVDACRLPGFALV